MEANFVPYEGNEPYIFVSYSHKDSERVLPILNAMNAAGYRVWYDEGIPWTSEWPAVIAQHILNCGICMAFLSSTSVESDHCRREIHFSQSEHKPILSAYLENVQKPVIKYELGMYQSVNLRTVIETNEFLSNLQKQDCFRACQAETSDVLEPEQLAQAMPTFQKEKTISAGNTYTTAISQDGRVRVTEGRFPITEIICVAFCAVFTVFLLWLICVNFTQFQKWIFNADGQPKLINMILIVLIFGMLVFVHFWAWSWFNTSNQRYIIKNASKNLENVVDISSEICHTVFLLKDGCAKAVGVKYLDSRCNVATWKNISAISTGPFHTIGICNNHKVVAVGNNSFGQCNLSNWRNIVAVAAGECHTVGLRDDGTVVSVGSNRQGQCNISNWHHIVAISAGRHHTVGLCHNNTVVAAGDNDDAQCEVSSWRDIVVISAGRYHTVGLRRNNTVIATGNNDYGQCEVSNWRDIVAVSAGMYHTVGLKSDGTVIAAGWNRDGQCNVSDWIDIRIPSQDDTTTV